MPVSFPATFFSSSGHRHSRRSLPHPSVRFRSSSRTPPHSRWVLGIPSGITWDSNLLRFIVG